MLSCYLLYSVGQSSSDETRYDLQSIQVLGVRHAPGSSPIHAGSHVSNGLPFLENSNVLGNFPFSRGTYPPSNVQQQGGNYFPRGNMYKKGYPSNPSPFMWGPYGSFGLKTPLPLDQNLFTNTQIPFLDMLELPDLSKLTNDPIQQNPEYSHR